MGFTWLFPHLLQSLMDAQNLRIEELLQKIKQQQYKLDKQNLQIKSLQSKVSSWAGPTRCWDPVGGEAALMLLPSFGDFTRAMALVLVPQQQTSSFQSICVEEMGCGNGASLSSSFGFICRTNSLAWV